MAKENKKTEGAASQADLNRANALAALQVLAGFALKPAQDQSQEVHKAANVLERVIHDAGETWSTTQEGGNTDDESKKN